MYVVYTRIWLPGILNFISVTDYISLTTFYDPPKRKGKPAKACLFRYQPGGPYGSVAAVPAFEMPPRFC